MKEIYTNIFIICLFVFSSFTTFGQRSNGIAVEGRIAVEDGTAEAAIIQMYQDGKQLDNYGVDGDGRYKVELNYNHKYELIFQCEGYFQQKIIVEADVPKTILNTDPKFPPFPVDINLFAEIPGIDKSFSENTILKIYYSSSVDNFVSELYYNDAQIQKLIEQAVLQGEVVNKRADYMTKLTRAELAELRKEYNKLLEQAGSEYSSEKFLAALDGYKAASKILPEEQFPKDRIAEINDLLGLIMAAEELDKAKLERFNALVREGDLFFNQTLYNDAKMSYNRALSIKPFDQYVNDQFKKIADLLKQQHDANEFNNLIAQGDKALKELLYNEAIGQFQKALEIRPNEQYPKNKINEINGLLADQLKDQERQKNYDDAMFEGEKQFTKQFYDRALTSFQNALSYRANDPRAKRRIEDTQKIMQEILDKMSYDKFIGLADKAYKKKDYSEALSNYEEALALIPHDPRIIKRVEEITEILQAESSFADFVAQADDQFEAKSYSEAKSSYERALAINGTDKHTIDQIATINTIIAQQEVDEQYNQIVTQGDDLFGKNEYENARNKYNEALSIKSKEKYPKDKIDEISAILEGIAKINNDYQDAIARAEKAFQQKDYTTAKTAFSDAGSIKPEETYLPEMISKINDLEAEQAQLLAQQEAEEKARLEAAAAAEAARLAAIQAEKDKNYTDAIARADNLFNEKEYENARTEYRVALDVKPEEAYPQQRIDEIGTLMAQLSAAQKTYEEAVAIGDSEFRREGWDAAIVAYNEAKQAKADETYPDEQIAKIDSIVSERARVAEEAAAAEAARLAAIQAEKDKSYADAIARANNLFNEKNYENARAEYRVALDIKPEEAYAQQRIDEIGTLMAQLSAAQIAYEEAVAQGDREFRRESWDAAIVAYNQAKQAKADETYPDEQIAKIDSIVSERARLAEEAAAAEAARLAAIQAEKDKSYADAIAKADNLFNEKEYENARSEYRVALDVKPEEAYAQQRIDEIGTLMAQLSAAQKTYEEAVANGDREFRREGWDAAIAAYNEAKQAKADETYPEEQIAQIDSIRAERTRLAEEAAAAEAARLAAIQAEKDKNYADAIARADNLFNEKNYENARTEYRVALDVKPEEAYPQQRIDEIGKMLSELAAAQAAQAELDRRYTSLIQQADRFLSAQNFASAKDNYQEASELKPDETYPTEKIAEIEQILEQQALNEKYRNIIVAADGFFRTQKYDDARLQYELALGVKEDEQYPRSQIMKIDEILNAEQQRILAEQAAKEDLVRRKEDIASMQDELDEQRILEERGINGLYDELISKADALFTLKQYNVSRAWYFKAMDLKPEESYPPQRIDEINRILNGLLLSQRDREYQKFVDLGDANFRDNELAVARGWYNQALSQKPDEEYPKTQLSEIAKRVADRVAGQSQQQYEKYKATAEKAFEAKDYNIARFWYKKALGLRENDEDIKEKLNEIDQATQQ